MVEQSIQLPIMDERRLAEQFAQTGNLMDLCADEAWLRDTAQREDDCGGQVEAGPAMREYVSRLSPLSVEQLQMVKLQSILFTDLRIWMETWELGQSFEATYTKARQIVRHHLKCLSPEQQTWVETLLEEDAQGMASEKKTVRSQTVAMLGKMLTQEDWQVLANTVAQEMAVRVLQMGQPDGVSAKAG